MIISASLKVSFDPARALRLNQNLPAPVLHKQSAHVDAAQMNRFMDRFVHRERAAGVFTHGAVIAITGSYIVLQNQYGRGAHQPTALPNGEQLLVHSDTNRFQTSAAEIALFLRRLLEEYKLNPGSSELCRPRFVQHPTSPDALYGFFPAGIGASQVLFHSAGDSSRSLLVVAPEHGLGFFSLLCSDTEKQAYGCASRLLQKLADWTYPAGTERDIL